MPGGLSRYFMFHGRRTRKRRNVFFHKPRELIVLGEAVAVEYACNKKHGGGDGKKAVYRHEFETPVVLCMDERCRGQLYIIGKEVKVTSAGVEN